MQIGLTVLKTDGATIPGTRLRGVAEAAGFRLADGGRFDWVQEETGAVLYALQNYRSEPFTATRCALTSTPGVVFLLDVPRVADPVARLRPDEARGEAHGADARRDAGRRQPARRSTTPRSAPIREQVRSTAAALREVHIEPGSPRALALFGG